MKITYDPKMNIAYIMFQEKEGQVRSIQLSEELVVDMSADGKIYGLELLNANEQLQAEDGYLHVINQVTGQRAELAVLG